MLQVLAHPDLPHQLNEIKRSLANQTTSEAGAMTDLVLIPVHTREGADVSEDVLKSVGKLEGVDVSESVLDVRVDDEFGKTKDFAT